MTDKTKITIGKCLGQGSYGKVYSCTTSEDQEYAVKIVDCDPKTGPGELLEASIMRTYQHQNLSVATYVNSSNSNMFIFQDLAQEDLSTYLKSNSVDAVTLADWSFSLVQGLWVLHSESIIHCDIKSANILKYHDNKIAITDFTLSVIAGKDSVYNHPICTLTYRPPEVMSTGKWSFPVDIWSLGCTMYEICTGKLLVPFQGSKIKEGYKSTGGKAKLKAKTYNCIVRWARSRGDPHAESCRIDETDDVHEIKYDRAFTDADEDFKSLVLWMTEFNPTKRPTIDQVLNHPYFKGRTPSPYFINSSPSYPVTDTISRCIDRTCSRYTSDKNVLAKTKEIYSRCVMMAESKSYHHILACVWIAAKIVTGGPIKVTDMSNTQIIDMERKICKYLSYRLHVAAATK